MHCRETNCHMVLKNNPGLVRFRKNRKIDFHIISKLNFISLFVTLRGLAAKHRVRERFFQFKSAGGMAIAIAKRYSHGGKFGHRRRMPSGCLSQPKQSRSLRRWVWCVCGEF
jgi:hypothetical protein